MDEKLVYDAVVRSDKESDNSINSANNYFLHIVRTHRFVSFKEDYYEKDNNKDCSKETGSKETCSEKDYQEIDLSTRFARSRNLSQKLISPDRATRLWPGY